MKQVRTLYLLAKLIAVICLFTSCSYTGDTEIYICRYDRSIIDEAPTLSSIQGLLAREGIRIYIQEKDNFWKDRIISESVNTTEVGSLEEAYGLFEKKLKKYVLCDYSNFAVGATVATSLDAFVVTERILELYPYMRKKSEMVFDVRGKDEYWLLEYVKSNIDKYSLDAITQHNSKRPAALIDLAIAKRYICTVCEDNPELMKEFYSLIRPNSPKFGFGTPYHNELKDVALGASFGLYTVPTANTMNLSFFSQTAAVESQKPAEKFWDGKDSSNVHHVMIMMSDGDNLNWTIGGCISNRKYMGNEACGNYPLNWMYPPEAMNVAGFVHNYYMNNRPKYNYFIGAVSGQGYTYPSVHRNLADFSGKAAESFLKAGLDYCVIMDTLDFRTEQKTVLSEMLSHMPGLKGIYYMDYGNYAKWKGDSYLIGNIPVHAFRYRLWLPMDPLEEIAEKINNSPTDPNSLDSYSSVVVHAWSYGIDDVVRFISLLDDDVRLVNADEYMKLLSKNVLKNN